MQEIKKRYVIPGDKIVEGNYRPLMNVIKNGNYLISTRVGIAEAGKEGVKVIPLSGVYIPRVNDLVIGKVVDRSSLSWDIDINSCFFAHLPAQDVFGRDFSPARDDMGRQLSIGDLIIARIVSFDRTRDPMLTVQDKDLGKIPYGEFIKISPTRVPRLIGKRGSMIQTIEQATLTRVIIGQNGIVVVTGRDIDGLSLAVKAIKMVEEESHTNNLTQKVKALLNVQDPVELEKSENINISSGDGIDPTPSQASSSQPNSSSGLSSGVSSPAAEQQQPTMEPQPTMEQQQPTMEQQPAAEQQQPTMEPQPAAEQQPTMEQQQPTMEPQPQQNSSGADPENTSKIDEEQSENQLSNNLTNTDQKEKKHDMIGEEDA